MAISLDALNRKSRPQAPRLLVFGTHGIGKTTLAAGAPNPVVIQTEDGIGNLGVPSPIYHEETDSSLALSYREVIDAIGFLYEQEHDRKTLILDSVDRLEPMIWAETCARFHLPSIDEKDSYGRGYTEADKVWAEFMSAINALRTGRGMAVILIAHAAIVNFKSPTTEPYDRYVIKLHKRASAYLQEQVDGIFFMNHRVSVVKDGATAKGKGGHARGVGGGTRVLYTEERPAFTAKRRTGLMHEPAPDMIDLPDDPDQGWATLAQHLTYYSGNTNAALAAE